MMTPDAGITATPGERTDPFAPLTSRMMPVGNGHEIYVETVGCAGGWPAVYLHGGPGSGCQPDHRKLFDPRRFHAALFDQRGSGRSRPKGGREANTTGHLIADMEVIRDHLGFEQWMVVGGSWGATLAIAYAQRYPQRVSGVVLRATFLGTRAELETAFLDVLPRFHPALNEDFLGILSPGERRAALDSYWRRILDPDPAIHIPAARAWYGVERILSEHFPKRTRLDPAALDSGRVLPSTPFMEAHYFQNCCFLEPDQLMKSVAKLKDVPGVIVQGRYDLLCPPSTAHALAAEWPAAELRTVEGGGHSLYDPGVRDAVASAIADLAAITQ